MRKFYDKFMRIPKFGRVHEKVILARTWLTVAVMVACLLAMSVTAYAYFSCNVTYTTRVIKTAEFKTLITIQHVDENDQVVYETVTTNDNKEFSADLKAGVLYTVTVTLADGSTAKTGFLSVKSNSCPKTYYTQQIGVDVNATSGNTSCMSCQLLLTDDATVEFQANWGTSSLYADYIDDNTNDEYYIIQNEEVVMIINGVVPTAIDNQNDGLSESLAPSQDE